MEFQLHGLAIIIGYWYARKYGREAVLKVNQYWTEKEAVNHQKQNQ